MELKVKMDQKDLFDYNIIGEIEGSDPDLKDEVVMLGAHFDSWHTGTGTTDNAAGSVVMLEAVRILKSLGLQPRRTVKIALWTGEEQGLFGSINYVEDTFAEKKGNFWTSDSIVIKSDEYDKFSAYYNLDNGVGQIRGVYLQQNENVRQIFREWLRPFSDWEAVTLSYNNTGGTDHLAFDNVGLPGFQFIQDPIEYSTLTHHSNMELYERAIEQDLQRNAAILASFVYLTAQMEEKLPRKESSYVILR
jgi:Zn-dependent M28 family amino/carboxypeptidase